MNTITINGVTITQNHTGNGDNINGNVVVVGNGRVIIDGVDCTGQLPNERIINIVVNGNCQQVKNENGSIEISGNVANASTVNGKITVGGDCQNANSVNGKISVGSATFK